MEEGVGEERGKICYKTTYKGKYEIWTVKQEEALAGRIEELEWKRIPDQWSQREREKGP